MIDIIVDIHKKVLKSLLLQDINNPKVNGAVKLCEKIISDVTNGAIIRNDNI